MLLALNVAGSQTLRNHNEKQVGVFLRAKGALLQVLLLPAGRTGHDFRHPQADRAAHDGGLPGLKRRISRITQDKILIDPVKLMILIYVCNDDSIPAKHVSKCKISPSTGVFSYRTDLEFYVLCHPSRSRKSATSSSSIATSRTTTSERQCSKSASSTSTSPTSTTST